MILLGIDLRTSPNHPSAVVAIDSTTSVTYLDTFRTNDELLELVQQRPPQLIAIGTPLGLPEGLCCLESACDCGSGRSQRKGRQSEQELARMGISCFFTNKGSIIRNLIYRGIQLNNSLGELGYPVIEVYPHATKVILFGDKVPPKNSSLSLAFMKERLPGLICGLDSYLDSLDRNACDALINAYTALLHHQDNTDVLGNEEEGLLALPRLLG